MTLSDIKRAKNEQGLSCEQIASRSGVPLSTVQKVFSGVTKRPRAETIRQLSKAFIVVHSLDDPQPSGRTYETVTGEPVVVRESAVDYGKQLALEPAFEPGSKAPFQRQGTYTIEDYYRVPDDRRVELIDGVFYDMTAPFSIHQHIAGFIHAKIYQYIENNHGDCVPFIAPADVRLDILKDDRTMVQPDVFIVCDEEKIKEGKNTKGAPDFVVEVLSQSTRKKDMTKKLQKYSDAGVREYWIIDPKNGQVLVYDFEHDCDMKVYSFADKVPVNIYDGKLVIDFPHMPKYITKLYDENWHLEV